MNLIPHGSWKGCDSRPHSLTEALQDASSREDLRQSDAWAVKSSLPTIPSKNEPEDPLAAMDLMLEQSLRMRTLGKRKQPETDNLLTLSNRTHLLASAGHCREALGMSTDSVAGTRSGDSSRPPPQNATENSGSEPASDAVGGRWRSQMEVINFLNSSASLNHDAFLHSEHDAAGPRPSLHLTAVGEAYPLAATSLVSGRGVGSESSRLVGSRSSLEDKLERCVAEYEEQRLIKSASETAAALHRATHLDQRSSHVASFPQSSSLPAPSAVVGSSSHIPCLLAQAGAMGNAIVMMKRSIDPFSVGHHHDHHDRRDAHQSYETYSPYSLERLPSQEIMAGQSSSCMQLPASEPRPLHQQQYDSFGSECLASEQQRAKLHRHNHHHMQPRLQSLSAAAICEELHAQFGSQIPPLPPLPAAFAPAFGPLTLQRYHSHEGKALSLSAADAWADAILESKMERSYDGASGAPTGSLNPTGLMSVRSPASASERMMMHMKSVSEAHASTVRRKVGRSNLDALSQQTLLAMKADSFAARLPSAIRQRETSSGCLPLKTPPQFRAVLGDREELAIPGGGDSQFDAEDDPEAALDALLQRGAVANSKPSSFPPLDGPTAPSPSPSLLAFPHYPPIATVLPHGGLAGEEGTASLSCGPASSSATTTSTITTHLHVADFSLSAGHGAWQPEWQQEEGFLPSAVTAATSGPQSTNFTLIASILAGMDNENE